jgi:hypothetical protein
MTKQQLIEKCSIAMANKCKKEIEAQGNIWKLSNGMQTINTLPRYWFLLYSKYPINSKTNPVFCLNNIYKELKKEGFIC